MFPHLPTTWWIIICLVAIIGWLFEASYRVNRKLRDDIKELKSSSLEIVFDPNNPSKRFWSMESLIDEKGIATGVFWEYRVDVKNKSSKTIRNVSLTTEFIGPISIRPADQIFDKIKKPFCNLKPECSELVPILRWPIPKRQIGMLADKSALAYGPIKVKASADNTMPTIRIFKFDWQREPMIYD